jgi:hypothetical protein
MKRLTFVCCVVLFAAVVSPADELVKNGSFEYPVAFQSGTTCGTVASNPFYWWCIAPNGFAGMEWRVEWADTPNSAGNLEFWRYPNAYGLTAPDGVQFVELDTEGRGSTNANVRISQSIATCPGASYALRYYYRSRPGGSAASQAATVRWAGQNVITHSGLFSPWQQGTATLTGMFGQGNLEFIAGGDSDESGMLLDNVSLAGPNPATVNACTTVNIKPYSDPNSVNVCASGTVPVTIWGSATFDVSTIDPALLMLGGAMVNTVGKTNRYQCSISDSGRPEAGAFDGIGLPDGYPDLTCHIETAPHMFQDGATSATVSMHVCQDGFATGCAGKLATQISATDAVRIVKDGCQ